MEVPYSAAYWCHAGWVRAINRIPNVAHPQFVVVRGGACSLHMHTAGAVLTVPTACRDPKWLSCTQCILVQYGRTHGSAQCDAVVQIWCGVSWLNLRMRLVL